MGKDCARPPLAASINSWKGGWVVGTAEGLDAAPVVKARAVERWLGCQGEGMHRCPALLPLSAPRIEPRTGRLPWLRGGDEVPSYEGSAEGMVHSWGPNTFSYNPPVTSTLFPP